MSSPSMRNELLGYDPREEVKTAGAQRWVDVVNAEGSYGQWRHPIAKKTSPRNNR